MRRLLLVIVILFALSIALFSDPCEPGQGFNTSYNGEECTVDVCPMPDPDVGPINPDVTFDPEFGEISLLVAALTDEYTGLQGFCPLVYMLVWYGNRNQTFHITLSYDGWTGQPFDFISYYNGVFMTVPDNVVWGIDEVTFDITNPGLPGQPVVGTCFYFKHMLEISHKIYVKDSGPRSNNPSSSNLGTTISFTLEEPDFVTIDIYNVKGQKIRQLVNQECHKGMHQILWNGKDNNDKSVSNGVYFYRIISEGNNGEYISTKKIILLK